MASYFTLRLLFFYAFTAAASATMLLYISCVYTYFSQCAVTFSNVLGPSIQDKITSDMASFIKYAKKDRL